MKGPLLELAYFLRLLARSPMFLPPLLLFGFLVWHEVHEQSTGRSSFSANDGIVAAVVGLRFWVLMVAALVAGHLSATVLERRMLPQVFINGIRPLRVVLLAVCAGGAAMSAAFWLLLVEAGIFSVTADSAGTGFTSGLSAARDVLILTSLIWLWAMFGSLTGGILTSRPLTMTFIIAGCVLCLIIERVGVLFPAVATVAGVTPLGASTVLLLGTFVPFFPQGESDWGLALAALTVTAALLWMALRRRYNVQRSGSLWHLPLLSHADRSRAVTSALRLNFRILAASSVVILLVGYYLPQSLKDAIPWRYKASWLASVAAETSPADSMKVLISELAVGNDAGAMLYVTPEAWQQVTEHRSELTRPSARRSAFNVLSVARPGTVVMDIGESRVQSDGSVLLPPQIRACLDLVEQRWRVTSLSTEGLGCEDAEF